MNTKILVTGLLLLIFLGTIMLSGCINDVIKEEPKGQIVSSNCYDGFEGFNYLGYCDVSVRNTGGEGLITVSGTCSGQSDAKELYFRKSETKSTTLRFDISFWHGSSSCRMWVDPSY